VYRLRMGTHVQTGVAGCFSLHEYDHHVIKKHEHTRPDKEDDRTKHLIRLRAQTGPVFLTYRSEVVINDLIAHVTEEWPLFSFTAADDVQHAVWRVADALVPAFVRTSGRAGATSPTPSPSRRAARRRRYSARAPVSDTSCVAFPDSQVQILPYKSCGSADPMPTFRRRARGAPSFTAARCRRHGEVSMFLAGRGTPSPWGCQRRCADERLDAAGSRRHPLSPAGIGDVRTDTRIDSWRRAAPLN
jgi:hypothetical protein